MKKIWVNEIMGCGVTQEINSTIVYCAFDTQKNICVEFPKGIDETNIKPPLLCFPKIDEIALYRQYIASLNDKELNEYFSKVKDEDLCYRFKIFCHDYAPELWNGWCDYEYPILGKITEEWCVKNNIPHKKYIFNNV